MTLLIHLATLIFVVGLGKQFLDTKCQENFDVGVKWGMELSKIEDELYSKKIYERLGEL
jgi:hypothetical protein